MKPGRNNLCSCGSGKKYKHCCERKLTPHSPVLPPEVLKNLTQLFNEDRYAELEIRARHLIELYPHLATGWLFLGGALHRQGKESLHTLRKTIELFPEDANAHNNLGNALTELGDFDGAIASFRKSLKLKPRDLRTHSNLLFALCFSSKYSPEYFKEEARKYGNVSSGLARRRFTSWNCNSKPERLKVGIVSGDLCSHPVGYFLETVISQIDLSRVELFAYSTSQIADDLTARLRPRFSSWRFLQNLSDEDAARLIHTDEVNILLDLSGHTAHNRLPIFSWKPAPLQVAWLGFFATTGVNEMDYLLADPVGVPEESKSNFSETVWYLPDTRLCFSPPVTELPVAALPALTNGYITLGSFQKLSKISDSVLVEWSKILSLLPNAHLRIQCAQLRESNVVEQFSARLHQHSIDAGRVALLGSVSREEYLESHSEVDMILDTFPYPGGTTTCEALWMGVPTLTLLGDTLLSRQGASLLSAAGLGEWIASSKEEYVVKAVALASNLSSLRDLRAELREQVGASSLFNAKHFARNLEDALWGMWKEKSKI